jgi:hypothetical protein
MKKSILCVLVVGASLSLMVACNTKEEKAEAGNEVAVPTLSQEELISRGRYLTEIGGCNDCHSPKMMTPFGPAPDTARLLSGHRADMPLPPIPEKRDWILFSPQVTAFVGPWGISFAANLTPDDTGIGNWKLEQFKTAIRKGKYKGLETGRTLLPPMPWQTYKDMNDQDLEAIFTYLKSLRPVNNLVPAAVSPDKISMK